MLHLHFSHFSPHSTGGETEGLGHKGHPSPLGLHKTQFQDPRRAVRSAVGQREVVGSKGIISHWAKRGGEEEVEEKEGSRGEVKWTLHYLQTNLPAPDARRSWEEPIPPA